MTKSEQLAPVRLTPYLAGKVFGCTVPVPVAPPVRLEPPQAKPVKLAVVPMLFPLVPVARAVTVTTPPLEMAVTPVLACSVVLSLTAVAILVANCVGLTAAFTDQYAKVEPEVVPSKPPLRSEPDQVKFDNPSASAILFPPVPGVAAVTVTLPVLEVAVTPTAE